MLEGAFEVEGKIPAKTVREGLARDINVKGSSINISSRRSIMVMEERTCDSSSELVIYPLLES